MAESAGSPHPVYDRFSTDPCTKVAAVCSRSHFHVFPIRALALSTLTACQVRSDSAGAPRPGWRWGVGPGGLEWRVELPETGNHEGVPVSALPVTAKQRYLLNPVWDLPQQHSGSQRNEAVSARRRKSMMVYGQEA